MEMYNKVDIEYTGPKPFAFLGATVLGGLGAVTGARRGGVLGAIAYSVVYAMAGTIIGYVIDSILEAIMRLTYQGLEVAMDYGNQG
jgi:outer membrane lipoprotein SlyB